MVMNCCKHNKGFKYGVKYLTNDYVNVFKCVAGCCFTLNFDPEIFPDGIAYRTEPLGEKVLPELRSSKF